MVEGFIINEKNKKGFRDLKFNGSDQRIWSYF